MNLLTESIPTQLELAKIVVLLEIPLLVFTLLLATESIPSQLELVVIVLELDHSPLLPLTEHILSLFKENVMNLYFGFCFTK